MRIILVALMLAPTAAAGIDNPDGPFPTRLHLHLNGPQDIVMTPQAPPETFAADHRRGILTHSTCIDAPGQGFTGKTHHTWYAHVSPMPVKYADAVKPAPERGILGDLHMSNTVLQFFISSPAAVPEAVLRATIREGDEVSVDHAAMDAGRLVAQAETEPALLWPGLSGHPHATHYEVNDQHVYGFQVPLPANTTIPAAQSFNLRIDLFIQSDACQDDYLMIDAVALHTSPALRPTLEFDVRQPIRIERLAVSLDEDVLRFHAEVAPVFGAADAILGPDAFQLTGPATQTIRALWNDDDGSRVYPAPARDDRRLHAHGSLELANATSGDYHVQVQIFTESGARAWAEVPFSIGAQTTTCSVLPTGDPTCAIHGQGDKKTPMPIWGALVLLLLARRR